MRIRDVVSTSFVSVNRVVQCTMDYTGHASHAQCLLSVFVSRDRACVAWLKPSRIISAVVAWKSECRALDTEQHTHAAQSHELVNVIAERDVCYYFL